jgi:hypothetical protein
VSAHQSCSCVVNSGILVGGCAAFALIGAVYVVPKLSQEVFNGIWKTRFLVQLTALLLAVRNYCSNIGQKLSWHSQKIFAYVPFLGKIRYFGHDHATFTANPHMQLSQLLPLQLWDGKYGAIKILPKKFDNEILCKVFTVAALGVFQPFLLLLAGFVCSHALRCAPYLLRQK